MIVATLSLEILIASTNPFLNGEYASPFEALSPNTSYCALPSGAFAANAKKDPLIPICARWRVTKARVVSGVVSPIKSPFDGVTKNDTPGADISISTTHISTCRGDIDLL